MTYDFRRIRPGNPSVLYRKWDQCIVKPLFLNRADHNVKLKPQNYLKCSFLPSKNVCDNEFWFWRTLTDFGCTILYIKTKGYQNLLTKSHRRIRNQNKTDGAYISQRINSPQNQKRRFLTTIIQTTLPAWKTFRRPSVFLGIIPILKFKGVCLDMTPKMQCKKLFDWAEFISSGHSCFTT